ncbi:MAG: DUF262 domain-containing protein [Saprospiraceae bacterium]
MSSDFLDLSIKELLANNRYSVPRYQRNYAWTEEHIKQLIDDVLDNANQPQGSIKPYYLGTLVVFPRHQSNGLLYEVIDGQQRLTTLTLLASYTTFKERNENDETMHWFSDINLDFESRKRSSETLNAAHNGSFHNAGNKIRLHVRYTKEIVDAYEIIQRVLPERCREKNIDEKKFADYFLGYVRICRVGVPEDTDLNHYFEIMNSRGEQLEKHEVLKARMLNKLSIDDQLVFNQIWEACSDLEKYIQYGFEKSIREELFGKNWDRFLPETRKKLYDLLKSHSDRLNKTSESNGLTLNDLILGSSKAGEKDGKKEKDKDKDKDKEEDPERFSSIINFQNFLPHALSIFLNNGAVPLDDKQLLDSFNLSENMGAKNIMDFSYALLKIRFLFDQNIIKRDATEDEREWSLKLLHQTDQGNPSYRHSFSKDDQGDGLQRQITLLQSMFHVSVPSRPYKYWLQGTLKFLYETGDLTASRFRDYLKNQAKALFTIDIWL